MKPESPAMDIPLPFTLTLSDPLTWLIVAVGLVTAVLVLFLLRYALQRLSKRRYRESVLRQLPPIRGEATATEFDAEPESDELGRRALERRSAMRRRGARVKV